MKIKVVLKSESGLIKVPQQLLKDVQEAFLTKVLSYMYYGTEGNSELSDVHNDISKLCTDYNIELITSDIELYGADDVYITRLPNELPKSYYNIEHDKQRAIEIAFDMIMSRSNAYFQPPNRITVCTRSINVVIYNNKTTMRMLQALLKRIMSDVEHELTHYVQFNNLHKDASKQHYDGRKTDGDMINYYTSPVEFDPQIKTALADFEANLKRVGKKFSKDLLAYYISAIDPFKIPYPGFGPSEFFDIIKRYKPVAYKRAAKLFTQLLLEANKG